MKKRMTKTAGLSAIAMISVAGTTNAAPVTYVASGLVESVSNQGDSNYAPGNAAIGDLATVRVTYDIQPDNVNSFSEGQYQYTLGAITSLVLSVNGEEYEFVNDTNNGNYLVQIDNESNNIENIDQFYTNVSTAGGPLGYPTSEGADLTFDYAPETFDGSNGLGLPTGEIIDSIGSFTLFGDGSEYTNIFVDFTQASIVDSSNGNQSIAVPTPAALGASVLLVPLLLRRKR
ncbi:hypothetical protein JD969_03980 [Planctomycetota bacterium]|nr:hypothetical protein JD969_03980 [Planctomycetota bacterium]